MNGAFVGCWNAQTRTGFAAAAVAAAARAAGPLLGQLPPRTSSGCCSALAPGSRTTAGLCIRRTPGCNPLGLASVLSLVAVVHFRRLLCLVLFRGPCLWRGVGARRLVTARSSSAARARVSRRWWLCHLDHSFRASNPGFWARPKIFSRSGFGLSSAACELGPHLLSDGGSQLVIVVAGVHGVGQLIIGGVN